jgi:hypothetical protein
MSQSIRVPVTSQIERRSDAVGSEEPRIHLRSAPSDRLIAFAVVATLPYEAIAKRSRSASPSILCGIRLARLARFAFIVPFHLHHAPNLPHSFLDSYF